MELTQLIERVKQQDQQAFEELYNQYYPAGFSLTLQFVKNENDALDIMQDAFITVYSKLDALEDATKFKSWYMQIVANKCRDFLKKQKPLSFTDANAYDEEGALQFDVEETNRDFIPEEAADYSETVRIVDEMIAELPEEQRLCVLLYFANDMSIPEIAQALQVSEATIKSRLKYGKDKIRGKVDAYQKKTGTKLYSLTGLTIIPFLRWALQQEKSCKPQDSEGAFARIMEAVSMGNHSQLAESASTLLSRSAPAAAANAGNTAAKVGSLWQHIASLTATQKIISGVVAGAIVLGTSAGVATKLMDSDKKETPAPTEPISSSYEETLPPKTQLYWEDYITVEYSGISGQATASAQVDFSALDGVFGAEKLKDFAKETLKAEKAFSTASLLTFTLSQEEMLANGDVVTVTVSPSEILKTAGKDIADVTEYFNVSFDTTISLTVADLEEVKEIDIFSMVKDYIVYTGSNGNAYAHFNFPQNYQQTVSDRIRLDFSSAEVTVNVDDTSVGTIDLSLIAPNPEVIIEDNLEFIIDENGPLTNGEMLCVEIGDYYLPEILEALSPLGYTIETLSYQLEVSGL